MQSVGQAPRPPDRLAKHPQKPVQLPHFRNGLGGEIVPQGVGQERGAYQKLTQVVMQVTGYATAFPFANLQDFLFQVNPVGDVPGKNAGIRFC
jgi:hypothetical protein